jgi:hypothetical protein
MQTLQKSFHPNKKPTECILAVMGIKSELLLLYPYPKILPGFVCDVESGILLALLRIRLVV